MTWTYLGITKIDPETQTELLPIYDLHLIASASDAQPVKVN